MSTRRERLRKAEKLLRQGRLEPAIAEYVALIEEEPTDWATTNALGDLYVRAKRVDQAVGQYTRIADHFWKEGFFPKAAALYKKILKVKPTDEPSLMRVGDISAQQGKLVDAKAAFTAIIALRRKRGDANAANEVVVRLGALDPQDLGARRSAAQAQVELGRVPEAIEAMGQLAADLSAEGKTADAVGVLKAVVELDPVNVASRARLARIYLATGNLGAAREYLTEEVAGDDPAMLLAVAELKLRGGDGEAGRDVIRRVIGLSPDASEQVMALAASLSDADAGAAFVCVDELAEVAMRSEDWEAASVVLQEFTERVPRHVDALVKLVDVCVDAGLDEALIAAQAELAEAYLDKGQVSEASVIAEDLAVREPSNEAHVDRYRRALVAAGDPDPDAKVAEQCHTEAAEGGVSDGLDDLGADFFDGAGTGGRRVTGGHARCGGRRTRGAGQPGCRGTGAHAGDPGRGRDRPERGRARPVGSVRRGLRAGNRAAGPRAACTCAGTRCGGGATRASRATGRRADGRHHGNRLNVRPRRPGRAGRGRGARATRARAGAGSTVGAGRDAACPEAGRRVRPAARRSLQRRVGRGRRGPAIPARAELSADGQAR